MITFGPVKSQFGEFPQLNSEIAIWGIPSQFHPARLPNCRLLHTEAFTHRGFYPQTLLHTEAFTHRRFCTQRLLHTEAFTHRRFYAQTLLHTNTFTHRGLYTQTLLLHTEAFTHRRFYTQTLLHTDGYTQTLLHTNTFTHRGFYTQKLSEINFQSNHCMSQSQTFTHTQTLLHTDPFTHRPCYTQRLLHTDPFTHRPFYAQTLLHTDAFTHRNFYTQTLSHTETGPVTSQFYLSFWQSNLISRVSVAIDTSKSQFYLFLTSNQLVLTWWFGLVVSKSGNWWFCKLRKKISNPANNEIVENKEDKFKTTTIATRLGLFLNWYSSCISENVHFFTVQ